ncbi:MAG TPA: hypothetical protein VHC22_32030 [Pirellulales bacterium]|nr:hypothetical protein [Pirellulales bacterium]
MLSVEMHVQIHAQPVAGDDRRPALFARTFEEVSARLAALPRMFVEPDGAFVWVAADGPTWQLDGVLYDGAGRLWYVELKGRSPQKEFEEFLSALGWPQTPVVFQLVREALLLDEPEFRRHAGWAESSIVEEPRRDRN